MSDSYTKFEEINSNDNRAQLNKAITEALIIPKKRFGQEDSGIIGVGGLAKAGFIDLEQQKVETEKFWREQSKLNNMKSKVDHPEHYGGGDNPYEAIKVIEAWDLGFNLGNTLKYISRAGKKDALIQELEKAAWYLNREINNIKNK